MIIEYYPINFTVVFEKEDWLNASTYILLELLKSIPTTDRFFNPANKIWYVNNRHKHILSRIQVFSDEEELDGIKGLEELLSKIT